MRRFLSALMPLALSACAVPQIDRDMLHAARAPQTNVLDRHLAVEEAPAGNPLSVGNKVTPLEDGDLGAYRPLTVVPCRPLLLR